MKIKIKLFAGLIISFILICFGTFEVSAQTYDPYGGAKPFYYTGASGAKHSKSYYKKLKKKYCTAGRKYNKVKCARYTKQLKKISK